MPKHRLHRERKVRLHASGKWVTEAGRAYDLVGEAWRERVKDCRFRNLRKSANKILCGLIEHEGEDGALQAVEEISKRFMGQKTPALVRLYRTNGKGMYIRMNRFLAKLGDRQSQDRRGRVYRMVQWLRHFSRRGDPRPVSTTQVKRGCCRVPQHQSRPPRAMESLCRTKGAR